MTIAHVAFRGSATNKTSGTTLGMSPSANLTVGQEVFVVAEADNFATVDGDSAQASLADTHGHTWTKVYEKTNTAAGAAADGVTVAMFRTRITTQITTANTITVTWANAITAKTLACHAFSSTEALTNTGTPGFAFVQAGASRDVTITGLNSGDEVLLVWVGAIETTGTAWSASGTTFDGDYTLSGGIITTTGGGSQSNVSHQLAYRITTGITTDTFTITAPPGGDAVYALVGFIGQAITVAGSQAVETDTANAGTVPNIVSGQQATETDTANAGGYLKSVTAEVSLGGTITAPIAAISLEMLVSKTLASDAGEIQLSLRQAGDTIATSAWTTLSATPTLLAVPVNHGDLTGWDNLTARWEVRTSTDVTAQVSDLTLEITSAAAQATETDTANAGSVADSTTGSQATETDTANSGVSLVGALGSQATETDTANGGTAAVTVVGSLASETDSANGGTFSTTVAGNQATETDTANAGTISAGSSAGGQATETDTAFSGSATQTGTSAFPDLLTFVDLIDASPLDLTDSRTLELVEQ